MKTVSKNRIVAVLCCLILLAVTVLLSMPVPAIASQDSEGQNTVVQAREGTGYSSKEEVVYARLGADGKAKEAYIVNILSVEKAGKVKDFGAYTSVKNMTTKDEIGIAGDVVTAYVNEGDFYYQGNIEDPKLPWFFEIKYKLNGVDIDPSKLGGQSGRLEIDIKTTANTAIDTGWQDNCMIQTQITLDGTRCRNIEADGGMIVNAGANKMISFTTLPGDDGDMHVLTDVNGFSMPGIQFSAVPLQMSIGDIDTSEISGELRDLTDAIVELDDGVGKMKNGARDLYNGMADFAGGAGTFQSGLVQAASGGTTLKNGSQSIEDGLVLLSEGLEQTAAGVSQMPGSMASQLAPAVSNGVATGVAGPLAYGITQQLQAGGMITPGMENDAALVITSVLSNGLEYSLSAALEASLSQGLTAAFSGDGSPMNPGLIVGLNGLSGGLTQLSEQYKGFDDGLDQYVSGVSLAADGASQLSGGASSLRNGMYDFSDGINELKNGTSEMRNETSDMDGKIQEKIDEMLDEYDKSGYVPLSFASPKNGEVDSIQFVFTTDAIEEPELPADEEEIVGKESIIDRLLALFK